MAGGIITLGDSISLPRPWDKNSPASLAQTWPFLLVGGGVAGLSHPALRSIGIGLSAFRGAGLLTLKGYSEISGTI